MNPETLKKFADATKNEIYDQDYYGGKWVAEYVETHETLEDFEAGSRQWNERSVMKSGAIAGLKFISWKLAQARKGQPRRSMSVVDFGDIRIALPGTDLSYF